MKVISILGSPKPRGNTAAILSEIERPLNESGAEVVRYCLGECDIHYCTGCKSCYESGKCIHNDDVQTIIGELAGSDLVIVASPSYWGDVTGQMKVFIDRLTPYCNTKHAERFTAVKGVGVAVRAGRHKEENENLIHTMEHFLNHLGIPLISSFTAEGVDTVEDLQSQPEILTAAYDFGKSIVSSLQSEQS